MPSKYRLRYLFRPLIQSLAKGLIKIGVKNPNIITVVMLLTAILSMLSLTFLKNLLLFAILVFLVGIFDGLDGQIARLTKRASLFGGFFDSIMDRISEFFIILGLIIYNWKYYLWDLIDIKFILFISYISSLMISYSRARAEVFFKGDFDIGLMARSERLFYIFITMLIASFHGFIAEFLFIYMWLVISTYIFRVKKISKQIKKAEKY